MYWNKEDSKWFKKVKEQPSEYQIIIDNDSVYVETDNSDGTGETECVYTFTSYGCEFIYGLLKHLGMNADFC